MDLTGKSYCPFCLRELEGRLVIDEHVSLVRRCPEHGDQVTPLFKSPDYLARALLAHAAPIQQHRCLVVEVTDRCDVGCATCSASSTVSGRERSSRNLVDSTIAAAKGLKVDVVALSGGEPLMREDLWQIADAIHSNISRVVLITSGRDFESNPSILAELTARAEWLEIYLQFDSLRDDVLKAIRTPSVTGVLRRHRLKLAISTGALTSAVCVVSPETPAAHVSELVTFCQDQGAAGVTFQPLRRVGRYPRLLADNSTLITVDEIQRVALDALGVAAGAEPFAQQPFDVSVSMLQGDEVAPSEVFFGGEYRAKTFRVATSSYWDATNYFEPFIQSERFYFCTERGEPLNSSYFRVAPGRIARLELAVS